MHLRPLLVAATLFAACPPADDDDRTIPPPTGCSLPALANVSFTFNIHFSGEDYPQGELITLMEEVGLDVFSFPFAPAVITELGPDPDSNRLAVTFTDATPPPDGEPPPEDPDQVRIVYELPLGYELPVELGEAVASMVVLDISGGNLVHGFGLWQELEDGSFDLLFLAEPSDTGLAWTPGPMTHPVFDSIETRDRACPNLNELSCAKTYNLSVLFEILPEPVEEGEDEVPGEWFELWPTEHRDFVYGGLELRVVNVWSFTHREIDPACTSTYDFSAERFSYFVTRTANSPPNDQRSAP